MDAATIRSLAEVGETLTVEFTQDGRHGLSDRQIVEAVVCMANGPGGVVLIGLSDDGQVVGAAPRHGRTTDPARLAALVLNKTDPHLTVGVDVVPIDDVEVIVIEVPPTRVGPVGTSDGVFRRRSIRFDGSPECIPYRPSEMLSAGLSLTGVDYGTISARDATVSDLDPREIDRLRRLCRDGGEAALADLDDMGLLRALRLLNDEGSPTPTLAAILLLGTPASLDRWAGTAECLFQDFRGGSPSANESLRRPLLQLVHDLEERIAVRNTSTEMLVGLHRVDIPLVATSTVREAIANALVHRDYTELGPVVVQIADDYLTVTSPGGLVPGVTVNTILEQSRPRSVVLADAFKRTGLVDRRGKGVNEMFETQLRAGRDVPDYSHSTARSVCLVLPTGSSDLDLVRCVLTYENEVQRPLTMDSLRVLHQIRAVGPSSGRELADDLHLVDSVTRAVCTRLTEDGLLDVGGSGRNRRYSLTARFYELAENRDAYVRFRGIQPVQREQMILEYVRRLGAITRGETASLCQTTGPQATALLRDMKARGLLVMEGERRTAHYTLPA